MKKILTIAIIAFALLGLGFFLDRQYSEAPVVPGGAGEDSLLREYILKLGETISVQGTSITTFAVFEDSRCPSDVQCIWAGRATAGVNLDTPMGFSTREMAIGENVTTETLKITIEDITPYPVSTRKTPDDEYRFVILVESHNPAI